LQNASEQSFQTLVERCPEPIVVLERDVFLYANPAFGDWLGYEADQLVGDTIEKIVHPDDLPHVRRRIGELGALSGPLPARETRLVRKGGAPALGETVPVRVSFRGRDAILVLGRDITERKQLQTRLMVSDRMASIGTLAASVAHEINNPLTFVLANLDRAADELRALSATTGDHAHHIQERLADALAGAERIGRIVRGLKIFSRAEDEKRTALNLDQVLETAISMSFNEIRHRARIVRDFGRTPLVWADEGRLCQVFINLLVNAAQAIREGDVQRNEIRVTTGADRDGRAFVEVRDTGAGIPGELKHRIFDPFFTTKPKGIGTGLGLSICHGIIMGLGGEITVQSELGAGAVFRIVLPPARSAVQSSAGASSSAISASRRARILLVDDDASVARAVVQMLAGHELTVARGGEEALSLILAGDYEVVICDLMMPQVTGMELYEELRRARLEMTRRFIFMTGGAFTPGARDFLEKVPNAHLEKPFRAGDLRPLVHALLHGEAP
jgi:PAS domain S-box-containing protein